MHSMGQSEHTVMINRPVEQVFDFLADGTNDIKWRAGVISIRKASGGNGSGATYEQVLKGPGGRKIPGDFRVTTFDRPSTLGFEVIAGPARPVGRFDLTPDGTDRCRVTFTLEVQPHGVMKLMTPMVNRQMEREVAALDQLKRVLDQSS